MHGRRAKGRMLRRAWACVALGMAACLSGCDGAGAYRKVLREQAEAFRETEKILAGITDAESLARAKVALQNQQDRAEAIKERTRDLPPPSEAIARQLESEIAELDRALAGISREVARVQANVPGGANVLKAFSGSGFLRD